MKKTAAVFAAWILFVLTPLGAAAQTTVSFLQGYQVQDGAFLVIAGDVAGEGAAYAPEDFSVTASGQECPVLSAETVGERKLPITYYCLVDVSGTMKGTQMEQVKRALTAIAGTMQDGDNMVIATLGNETVSGGYLTDPEKIAEEIDTLAAGKEDTNLYAGIVDSIGELLTNGSANEKKCLIVFSDGKDDRQVGITQDEAQTTVTDSRIPVYTVATLADNPTEEQLEYGKLLGSFARSSAGGAHYTVCGAGVSDAVDGEEAGGQIAASMTAGVVLTLDVSGIETDKDVLLLHVVYTSADGNSYADDLSVYAAELPRAEITEEVAEPDTEEPEPEPEGPAVWQLALVAAAVVIVLAVILAVVLTARKKKKQAEEAADREAAQEAAPEDTAVQSEAVEPQEEHTPAEQGLSGAEAAFAEGGYELLLSAIGYNGIVYTAKLKQGKDYTVGRGETADIRIAPDDRKLSGVHCRLLWDGKRLYVWDMNSTNGTFVNGIPIREIGRASLKKGETLRIGSYEYRIG